MTLDMKSAEEIESHFTIADYIVFASMLLVSSAIGVFYAWKDRNNESNKEFLTANRSLSVFPVSMSLLASFQSSVTILGYPAEMFYRGTQFWAVIISSAAAATIAAELFLPVYYNLQFTSINKYLEERFRSKNVRIAVSISFLMCTIPYMGVVLYGPALALGSVTPLSVSVSIILIGSICTLYTSIGGIKAVVWTDVFQVLLMFGGLIAVMIRGFYLVGGISEAFQIANDNGRIQFFNVEIDPYSTSTLWNAVFGMGIMWTGNYCTSQTEVQRYCNVSTKGKAKLSLYLNLIGAAALISCSCLCGVALYAYYSKCDPMKLGVIKKSDQLMPYFVMDQLTVVPGLPGLFVACVFSAALSTLSSGFNALAAVTYDDILNRFDYINGMSDRSAKTLSKVIAFTYGMGAIGMAFVVSRINSVLQAAISIAGALIGPMLGLFFLGILFPFANTTGVLSGLFIGEAFGLFIVIGSIIFPKAPSSLSTSIEECPLRLLELYNGTSSITQRPDSIGIQRLFHISYLLIPISGFVISLTIGSIISLLTGGHKHVSKINPELLSPLAWKIWPSQCLPDKSEVLNEKFTSLMINGTKQSNKTVENGNINHSNGNIIKLYGTTNGGIETKL